MATNKEEFSKTDGGKYEGSSYDKSMSKTASTEEINEAVYGSNLYARRFVLSNPLLTHDHFHYLYPLYKDSATIYFLMKNRSCPADLLYKVAVEDDDPVVRDFVAEHPNVTKETLVIISLRRSPAHEAEKREYDAFVTETETARGLR